MNEGSQGLAAFIVQLLARTGGVCVLLVAAKLILRALFVCLSVVGLPEQTRIDYAGFMAHPRDWGRH